MGRGLSGGRGDIRQGLHDQCASGYAGRPGFVFKTRGPQAAAFAIQIDGLGAVSRCQRQRQKQTLPTTTTELHVCTTDADGMAFSANPHLAEKLPFLNASGIALGPVADIEAGDFLPRTKGGAVSSGRALARVMFRSRVELLIV